MITQELLDFINQQSAQGVSRDEIARTLIDNGWQKEDIDEALASAGQAGEGAAPTQGGADPAGQEADAAVRPPDRPRGGRKTLVLAAVGVVLLAALAGGAYFLMSGDNSADPSAQENTGEVAERSPVDDEEAETQNAAPESSVEPADTDQDTKQADTAGTTEEDGGEASVSGGCDQLPGKLRLCAEFSCTFVHPFTNTEMERRVLGFDGQTCLYEEEMPNGGMLECAYDESMRTAVADYYEDLVEAGSFGSGFSMGGQGGGTDTTYTIDGKEVSNPLEEAVNSGICIVSGY